MIENIECAGYVVMPTLALHSTHQPAGDFFLFGENEDKEVDEHDPSDTEMKNALDKSLIFVAIFESVFVISIELFKQFAIDRLRE